MLSQAVVEFFKHKVVGSIIILTCWPAVDQFKLTRQITQHGLSATTSCDPSILDHIDRHRLQGVLYIHGQDDDNIFEKVQRTHFYTKYKWLIIGDKLTNAIRNYRYDTDITFLKHETSDNNTVDVNAFSQSFQIIHFNDVYAHPRDGLSLHSWAYWTRTMGLVLTHERDRILRRHNLKKYPLRIATPVGHYSYVGYEGTFKNWLDDETISIQDPGIRSAYQTSSLLIESVNAQEVVIENELWAATINNDSMYVMLSAGEAELAGGILRIRSERIYVFDFIVPIWPFRVGFTYLAERESSTNMYLEPFSPAVWWTCLAMIAVLALVQRVTSKSPIEKDGALYTVLTTYLQQDASAVPEGASGRWTFTVLSVSAMLVHAYYTSAIVSALMSTGRGGPDSLRGLADSKYAIASDGYDYMRYLFFDVETTWDDLEYLKKKKKTSKFYQDLETGVKLIEQGNTAFHSEYNQIYPRFKKFSDDHICKLQHVDTVPESLTWITSPKDAQWTAVLRVAGMWFIETGLGKRLVTKLRIPQPPCRAALLAERVKIGDVAPLLIATMFGAFLSMIILGIEIITAKAQKNTDRITGSDKRLGFVNDVPKLSEVVQYGME